MTTPLEIALTRALSIRLNLQMTLSSLPIVEEWMDIHLDRWLEHLPTPPEMPQGHQVSFLVALASDLKRMWWGAWGEPGSMVPKLADYLKLCNIAKSDAAVLDQMGEHLEPRLVGPWVGVWGGKVTTGWHFCDPIAWSKLEPLFGTHEAKFQIKKWVHDQGIERIERFGQAIGDAAFSEIELAVPGETVNEQVDKLVLGFRHFSGADLPASVVEILRGASHPAFALSIRMRGGQVVRTAAIGPSVPVEEFQKLCGEMKTSVAERLENVINTLAREGPSRVEIGRAGDRGGVDIYVEPTEAAPKVTAPPEPAAQAN
ncbi:MAG TPA: hypothetical protein VHE35_18565 [Kofleriaceae bacterium]|nr:hypothetical protein [Kofleriaceae bacterium]